jgi:hypothetical protein
MVYGWMRFGEKICQIVHTWVPRKSEMLLANTVTHPMPSHIHRLSATDLNCGVAYTDCTLVIRYEWSGSLGES